MKPPGLLYEWLQVGFGQWASSSDQRGENKENKVRGLLGFSLVSGMGLAVAVSVHTCWQHLFLDSGSH